MSSKTGIWGGIRGRILGKGKEKQPAASEAALPGPSSGSSALARLLLGYRRQSRPSRPDRQCRTPLCQVRNLAFSHALQIPLGPPPQITANVRDSQRPEPTTAVECRVYCSSTNSRWRSNVPSSTLGNTQQCSRKACYSAVRNQSTSSTSLPRGIWRTLFVSIP